MSAPISPIVYGFNINVGVYDFTGKYLFYDLVYWENRFALYMKIYICYNILIVY